MYVLDHMPLYTVFVAENVYLSMTFYDRVNSWSYIETGKNERTEEFKK
jgi:hypothetical protein